MSIMLLTLAGAFLFILILLVGGGKTTRPATGIRGLTRRRRAPARKDVP